MALTSAMYHLLMIGGNGLPRTRTAIVIGTGVVGLATAYALSRRGWTVTLIDRENGPGLGASHANGAQLSYCYADALASPALLARIPAMLLGADGVGLSPSLKPEFVGWLARFARNCTARRFERNTLAALKLAAESREAMADLLARHSLEFAPRMAGKMHLYFSEAEFRGARASVAMKAQFGCEQSVLTPREATGHMPEIASLEHRLSGAIFTPSEEVGDAYRFCTAMLGLLRHEYGARAIFGSAVEAVHLDAQGARAMLANGDAIEAGTAVICGGSASDRLLRPLGVRVPLLPMKGYSFEMPHGEGSPDISITDTQNRIVYTNLGDRMRVAGFADLGNGDRSVDPMVIQSLIARAQARLPLAGDYALATRHWAGLRPMTPNSQPIIARPRGGLAVNLGHGMLGWTLAMGSGERLARLFD